MKLTPYLQSFGITQEELDFMVEHEGFSIECGNWDIVNNNRDSEYYEIRRKNAYNSLKAFQAGWRYKFDNDPEFRNKMSEISSKGGRATKEKYPNGTFGGKKHADSSKKKIGEATKITSSGNKNSQYGTRWIYSNELRQSKKIKKNDDLPNGWCEGRKIKF